MSHRVLTSGRPALNSLKQLSPSHTNLHVLRRLHDPISRKFGNYSRNRPVPLNIRSLRTKLFYQTVRNCSYNNIMCRAKDDHAAASVHVSQGREVLPSNVKPVHYSLTLEPNFEKFTYEGEVVIEYVKPKIPTPYQDISHAILPFQIRLPR